MKRKKEHDSLAPIGYDPRDYFDAREVSIKDTESPYSLLSLTEGPLKAAIEALPDDLVEASEADLKKLLNPDELTCRLRIQFWDEYNAACDQNRMIRPANVMRGLTFAEYFYKHVLSNEAKVAWIVKPPQDFLLAMRDLLYLGLERLREIMTQPLVDKIPLMQKGVPMRDHNGNVLYKEIVNSKLITEIRQITEKLSDRVHGAVIQRMQVDQRNANLHVVAGADPLSALPTDALAALDSQLQNINQRIALAAPKEGVTVELGTEILLDVPAPGTKKPVGDSNPGSG